MRCALVPGGRAEVRDGVEPPLRQHLGRLRAPMEPGSQVEVDRYRLNLLYQPKDPFKTVFASLLKLKGAYRHRQ